MTPARVVAVGLGPAGIDLILPAARREIERIPHRFARTLRHPAIDELRAEGVELAGLDEHYERGPDLDAVYASIVDTLAAAAGRYGEVCYLVPGSPAVAERTVAQLRDRDVELVVVPGLSFVDLAWARLGVDPMAGARVLDGHAFRVEAAGASGPLLVAQCDSRFVLSDVKLSLLEVVDADRPVTVLQRLGRADERVFDVVLSELDRSFEPDHLTSVFVDLGGLDVSGEFARLVAVVERLRGPGGCPWDAKQTHHSLARHLIEEAYEVVEAVEALPPEAPGDTEVPPERYAALEDELGDLLFEVVIHSVLAAEAGAFTVADVNRRVHDKLIRRHPHVFGTVEVTGADEVVANWEQIKKAEKGGGSLVDEITASLPALLYAHKLFRKAAAVGLEPEGAHARLRLVEAAEVLVADPADPEGALGEVLARAAELAASSGLDAESALRGWAGRFRDRFLAMERLAAERSVDLVTASGEVVAALWDDAGDMGSA